MPRCITLEDAKKKLPAFVKIHDDTYLGVRYKATFTDLEYNEDFEAVVHSVIRLQCGCKSRSNHLRSIANKQNGRHKRIPIEQIIAKLPPYLEMDAATYKGTREKATFYDNEYKVTFEMLVCNAVRHGKGYCKQRFKDMMEASILSREEIDARLELHYKGRIKYVTGYTDYTDSCQFEIDGRLVKSTAGTVLSGYYYERYDIDRWKALVLARDMFKCAKCGTSDSSSCHHILDRKRNRDQQFNVNNGIVLCWKCHTEYHAKYKFQETIDNFCEFLSSPDLEKIIKERLAAPLLEAPRAVSKRKNFYC